MITVRKPMVALYVMCGLPSSGLYGIPKATSDRSFRRKPMEPSPTVLPTQETELEPVPGHYVYMLDLPFLAKERCPMTAEQV
jgi:hypothetical protein